MKEYKELIKKCRFSTAKTKYTINGRLYVRMAIVLRDVETNLVIWYTDFADYVLYLRHKDQSYEAKNDEGIYAVEQFLNYILIDGYERFEITDISEVKIEMVKDFLQQYSDSKTNTGKYPSKMSVVSKRNNISSFLWNICYYQPERMKYINGTDLLENNSDMGIDGYMHKKNEYKLKIRHHKNTGNKIYRDMPLEIVERIIKMAEIYDPEIVFAIVLMAYAGLRVAEVCNVRQKLGSCYGPGMIINEIHKTIFINGKEVAISKCSSIEIDLSQELLLRSDGVWVGNIKRERPQPFYPGYTDLIYHYYRKHMKLINGKETEIYKPLFINKTIDRKAGKYMALTKVELTKRIKKLFYEHVVPSLEKDKNYKFQVFNKEIKNRTWGPHSFRHWFTVSLVLKGCSAQEIKTYRGDGNIRSANTYLDRKGELQLLYEGAVDVIAERITEDYEGEIDD